MNLRNALLEHYTAVFNKLADSTLIKNAATQFKIYKVHKQLATELQTLTDFRIKLEQEFFEIGENGQLKFEEGSTIPVFKKGKDGIEYTTRLNAILSEEVEINTHDISLTMEELQPLSDAGVITPKDFAVLEDFLEE